MWRTFALHDPIASLHGVCCQGLARSQIMEVSIPLLQPTKNMKKTDELHVHQTTPGTS